MNERNSPISFLGSDVEAGLLLSSPFSRGGSEFGSGDCVSGTGLGTSGFVGAGAG